MQRTQPTEHNPSPAIPWRSAELFAIRYGSGSVPVLAAILVLVVPGEVGATGSARPIGAGLSLRLLKAGLTLLPPNLLARFSAGGDRGREREEGARGYLDEPEARTDKQSGGRRMPRQRRILREADLSEEERKHRPAAAQRILESIPETR